LNWINTQIKFMVSQWDSAIATYYPEHRFSWEDPIEHFRCINEEWNYLNAVQEINWQNYLLNNNLIVLELGAGTGWLSAFLSKFNSISSIYAVDSSQFFINKMMPNIIKLMDGETVKITPVEGLFTPILFEDNSIDIVIACSALHHVDNLESVLKEVFRVLKPDGKFFILNETPLNYFKYILLLFKIMIKILFNSILRKYKIMSQQISSNGILYDPALGDRIFPLWLWKKTINKIGFSFEVIKTKYRTYKKKNKSGTYLYHFICIK